MDQNTTPEMTGPSVKRGINTSSMIRWGLWGVLLGIFVGIFALAAVANGIAFFVGLIATVLIMGFIGSRRPQKDPQVHPDFKSNEGLTKNQKILAWVFSFLNPVIAGAVMYFMWKGEYPNKAKQANHISLWVFLIYVISYTAFAFFVASGLE